MAETHSALARARAETQSRPSVARARRAGSELSSLLRSQAAKRLATARRVKREQTKATHHPNVEGGPSPDVGVIIGSL